MKIATITAKNVQGLSFAQTLQAANVICGKNYAGKTAIAKAIRLGLTQKLPPPIGVAGIYKLAGNFEHEGCMAIGLKLDNERSIDLEWTKSDRGGVSLKGAVPTDLKMPDLLCEPRMFFSMTAADRIKTIFAASVIPAEQFSEDTILKRLGEVSVMPTAICEQTLNLVEQKTKEAFGDDDTIQSSTEKLVTWLKNEAKQCADEAKTHSGAFAGLRAKLGASRPVDQTKAIAEVETEITKAYGTSGAEHGKAWQKVEDAKKQLDRLGIIGMFTEAVENETTRIEERQAAITTALAKLNEEKPVDVVRLTERETKLNDEIVRLQDALATSETERDSEVSLSGTVAKMKLCAACKKKLNSSSVKLVAELDKEITTSKIAIDELEKKMSNLAKELDTARESNHTKADQLQSLTAEQTKLVDRQNAINAAYSAYRTASKEMSACQPFVEPVELKDKLAGLKAQQRDYDQHRSDLKRRDELETQLLAAQCQAEVFKKVRDIVIEEQEKVMTFAFNEVLKVARHFTDGLLNSPIEFANGELGRRVSNLDEQNGNMAPIGSWISHETFSGTEELLAYAGFSIALAQHAPVKLIVMDELGRMRREVKHKLLGRMVQLVKDGIIHQFIGLDVEIGAKQDDVNYIEL